MSERRPEPLRREDLMQRRSATRCGMTASVKPPLAAAPASAVVEVATWSGTETLRASGVFTQKG